METSTKKIIKKTTPGQFRILVDCMDKFPELATSTPVFGKSKAKIEAKWDGVAQKINAAGPPMRQTSDWKRVWADLKCRTKAKLSENSKEMKVTGGGPCNYYALTDVEKDIDRICQLSIAAVPAGDAVGIISNPNMKNPIVLEITPPRRSTNVAVVTPTTASVLSPVVQPDDIPTTSNVASEANHATKRTSTNKKRKIVGNEGEEAEAVKRLRVQVEQNNELVAEMKAQTRRFDSMADSLRGIELVMRGVLKHFTKE